MNQQQNNYISILNSLKEKIRHARYKAASAVNVELLKLYWEIGHTILEQQKTEGWGAKVIDILAADLRLEFPDFKGLSVRNLKYMRAFAEAWTEIEFVQPVVAQIQNTENQAIAFVQGALAQNKNLNKPIFVQASLAQISWYHHITLLDKVKATEERLFYLQKTIENGWSRDIMVIQIESRLYERQGKAISNFKNTLPATESDLVRETFKNPYIFDFLTIGEEAKERDVERALIQHLKKFMRPKLKISNKNIKGKLL